MKTASFIAATLFTLSAVGAAQAADQSTVTREQVRQQAIEMLRSGVPNDGEGYQNQLPAQTQTKVTRDAVRADARAANRSNIVTGGDLYQ